MKLLLIALVIISVALVLYFYGATWLTEEFFAVTEGFTCRGQCAPEAGAARPTVVNPFEWPYSALICAPGSDLASRAPTGPFTHATTPDQTPVTE